MRLEWRRKSLKKKKLDSNMKNNSKSKDKREMQQDQKLF